VSTPPPEQSLNTAPALGGQHRGYFNGAEPMLGGARRVRLDRDLLRSLLNFDDHVQRAAAMDRVMDLGAARVYAAAMATVLTPKARYYQIGRLWKVPYTYEQKLAAMDSLVKLDPDQALSGLVVALGNDDTNLQRAAIWLIGQLEGEAPEQALIAILDDARQEIRHAAVPALAHRWQEPQIARLVNVRGTIVAEAAAWLGMRADSRCIPVLGAVLRDQQRLDQHYQAQVAIVQAIGRLAGRFADACAEHALRLLREVLDDRRTTPGLYDHAVAALRRIDTDDARAAAIVYETSAHGFAEL
jgi:hypothetical protein